MALKNSLEESLHERTPGISQMPYHRSQESLLNARHCGGIRDNAGRPMQFNYGQRGRPFAIAARFTQQEVSLQFSKMLGKRTAHVELCFGAGCPSRRHGEIRTKRSRAKA